MPTDLDSYQEELTEYLDCDMENAQELFADFKRLSASAQYGVSEAQAKSILSNMAKIQETLESNKERRENYDRINNRRLNHITLQPE